MTSGEIGLAPVVSSRTRPPSFALTLEKTSVFHSGAKAPPLPSPRSIAARLLLNAARNSPRDTGFELATSCMTCMYARCDAITHGQRTRCTHTGAPLAQAKAVRTYRVIACR